MSEQPEVVPWFRQVYLHDSRGLGTHIKLHPVAYFRGIPGGHLILNMARVSQLLLLKLPSEQKDLSLEIPH